MDQPVLLHRPLDRHSYAFEAKRHCPHVLETWLRFFPDAQPASRDFEDWAENAHVLHALAKRGRVEILDAPRGGFLTGDRTPMVPPRPDAPKGVMWGVFSAWDGVGTMGGSDAPAFPADLLWNAAPMVAKVQDHFSSPTFLAAAGRRVAVCDVDRGQIDAALLALHDAGIREGFVKTRAKGATSRFTMGEDRGRLFRDMDTPDDDWGWMLVSHEGAARAIVVQEAFEPLHEYRTIVVGRRPVTGAGCVESMTPCDNEGAPFDQRTERTRGDGVLVRDAALVNAYEAFARDFAARWADAHGDDAGYSLDLALDGRTGSIVAIEMNPLMNLGLYATDPDLMVDAMLRPARAEATAA